MRTCFLLAVLALCACKKSGAPSSGVELVYRGSALTSAAVDTVNRRLAALDVRGVATLDGDKLSVRVDSAGADAVKRSLGQGARLEFFGVEDSTSKKLCGTKHADEVALETETLVDGSVTCFFSGPAAAVRTAAGELLGAQLRLAKMADGKFRSYSVALPPFLTGQSLTEAKAFEKDAQHPSPGINL